MEENKYDIENNYFPQYQEEVLIKEEEPALCQQSFYEEVISEMDKHKSIHGDSGFDELIPHSFLDELHNKSNPLLKSNTVFSRLFSDSDGTGNESIEKAPELDAQAIDVLEFFNKRVKTDKNLKRYVQQLLQYYYPFILRMWFLSTQLAYFKIKLIYSNSSRFLLIFTRKRS